MSTSLKDTVFKAWNVMAILPDIAKMRYGHFVVLDIETTGLSPTKGGRIIEIGAVRILNGVIQDKYQTFIDPEMKIPKVSRELTGITDDMVAGKPTIGQVLPEFQQYIGDAVVVCHNAAFDWKRFLLPLFKKVGIHMDNVYMCTYAMFKKADPKRGAGGYKLSTLCEMLGIEIGNHHRADDDALATAKAFLKIQEAFVNAEDIEKGEIHEKIVEHTPVDVRRVKYWEKRMPKNKMIKRQYVTLRHQDEFGTVFFDIGTRTWYNKDFPLPLDFKLVEKGVLEFLSLADQRALLEYKSK